MRLLKDLPELLDAGVITPETADKIREYYKSQSHSSGNRLFVVFGILGAILVGLGIILILAHNWDELSRSTQTTLAFLPLLLGQVLVGYVLLRKQSGMGWRESSAAFLFFAVGASIALVSQIYNIQSSGGTFILTWMLLGLPLVYVLQAAVSSLLYLSGITYYAVEQGYWSYNAANPYLYWLLLLGILPFYYQLFRKNPNSNFTVFHHWVMPLSVTIALATVAHHADELLFIAYFSLFGIFYLLGNFKFFAAQKVRSNGYLVLGWLGTVSLALFLSFNSFWQDLSRQRLLLRDLFTAPELYVALVITLLATGLFYIYRRQNKPAPAAPIAFTFLLFIAAFLWGLYLPGAVVLMNGYVLFLGVVIIRNGAKQNHLGQLNSGLLLITALVFCRFFDTDLSFVIRGILFVLVGSGFFTANYLMLRKRNLHEL